jgi:hypothetical protein
MYPIEYNIGVKIRQPDTLNFIYLAIEVYDRIVKPTVASAP